MVVSQVEQTPQAERREVRLGSTNRLTEESIIAELMKYEGKGKKEALSRKEMKVCKTEVG